MLFLAMGVWFLPVASFAAGSGGLGKDRPVKELMPWYHSTDEIHTQMSDLCASCAAAGADAEMSLLPSGGLDMVRIKATGAEAGTKAVIVFGEHARELISPESAVGLVRSLCGTGPQADIGRRTLSKGVEFVIVPNANPRGRKIVEEGYYCKRTNENGVDLNRNWGDDHRNGASQGDEANPGPSGFSENETQALRDLVDEEKPDIYLSVHSGFYVLGATPGYKNGQPDDEAVVAEVLKPISDKYCGGHCPYGGLRDLLGYNVAGCDIDYVHDHSGVPYAFTWEIYNGISDDPVLLQRQSSRSRTDATRSLRGRAKSTLTAGMGNPEDDQEPQNCIQQFIPKTEAKTKEVVNTWTEAMLDLASSIVDRKKRAACKEAQANGSPLASPQMADCLTMDTASDGSTQQVPTAPAVETNASAVAPAPTGTSRLVSPVADAAPESQWPGWPAPTSIGLAVRDVEVVPAAAGEEAPPVPASDVRASDIRSMEDLFGRD